jgi:hypothetical protein
MVINTTKAGFLMRKFGLVLDAKISDASHVNLSVF